MLPTTRTKQEPERRRDIAVVTGASGGIGSAIVEGLLSHGFSVMATDTSEIGLKQLRKRFSSATSLYTERMDVTDRKAIERVVRALKKIGTVSVLINGAGIFRRTPLSRLDEQTMQEIVGTNLTGTLRCMSLFSLPMAKNRRGRIINIASVAGECGAALAAVYAASKAGIIAATRSAARELAPYGIVVNAVAPGFCDTAMLGPERSFVEKFVLPRIPAGRFAEADEVAEVVLFLATCRTTYLNGAVMTLDGALHVG